MNIGQLRLVAQRKGIREPCANVAISIVRSSTRLHDRLAPRLEPRRTRNRLDPPRIEELLSQRIVERVRRCHTRQVERLARRLEVQPRGYRGANLLANQAERLCQLFGVATVMLDLTVSGYQGLKGQGIERLERCDPFARELPIPYGIGCTTMSPLIRTRS